jgi:hypothetical protein
LKPQYKLREYRETEHEEHGEGKSDERRKGFSIMQS